MVEPVYKFMRKSDVHFLLNGSLKFGSLETYRQQELKQGDKRIGDQNEGLSRNSMNFRYDAKTATTSDKRALDNMAPFIKFFDGPLENLLVEECSFDVIANCFVMSTSIANQNNFAELTNDINRDAGKNVYDGCVEIKDFLTLWKALRVSRLAAASDFADIPLDEIFAVQCGPVKYQPLTVHEFSINNQFRDADPLLKDLSYRHQREARFILRPKVPKLIEYCARFSDLRVQVSNPQEHFREIDLSPYL